MKLADDDLAQDYEHGVRRVENDLRALGLTEIASLVKWGGDNGQDKATRHFYVATDSGLYVGRSRRTGG